MQQKHPQISLWREELSDSIIFIQRIAYGVNPAAGVIRYFFRKYPTGIPLCTKTCANLRDEKTDMETENNSFLMEEPLGKLMGKYAIPCIISLLVGALYNIVDQIFIANAVYLGSYGNAANTVVFPLTVIALAIAVMAGDGCCAFVSLSLGRNKPEDASKSMGNSILLTILFSLILCVIYLMFSSQIIAMFGGTVNEETFYHSKEYFFWISLGIPFYMFGQAMNPVIRADGSPQFAMMSTLMGAGLNKRVKDLFTKLLTAEACVGVIALIIVELFPRQLIGIFGAANESVL